MFYVLKNRTYRHLFLAQVVALLGTGLATVALGFLAYDLAGADAGEVLGIALTIKMVAFICIGPIATAFTGRFSRRALLVCLDLVRAAVAVALPFVTEVWQIYVLIFLLQSASAGFTPTFQATIPDVLPEEEDYTNALSLSRLAYDLESLVSPMLAAALISIMSFHSLFFGTTIGFIGSALLVVSVMLPKAAPTITRGIYDRTTRGIRIYLATPRLRGLLCITLAAACASAMVIINTVVLVQGNFGLAQNNTALGFAAFGGGSMLAAFILPRLLKRLPERTLMIGGAFVLAGGLALGPLVSGFWVLLPLWLVLGAAYSMTQTPSGRIVRRSSNPEDLPALFAAQFALSHSCWLIAYPVAGFMGARFGTSFAFEYLAIIGVSAALASLFIWPKHDPLAVPHRHDDLPDDHPHIQDLDESGSHQHDYVIDDLHARWPLYM